LAPDTTLFFSSTERTVFISPSVKTRPILSEMASASLFNLRPTNKKVRCIRNIIKCGAQIAPVSMDGLVERQKELDMIL